MIENIIFNITLHNTEVLSNERGKRSSDEKFTDGIKDKR